MKKIVIAPIEAHQNLYQKYRKDNPFQDIKFYSKESILKEAYYQSDDNAILYLIKNHDLDFDLASEYLKFIKRLPNEKTDNEKIDKLISLKKELLENNLLFKNDYFDYEISNAEIDVYFYSSKDKELNNILKNKKVNYIANKGNYPQIYSFNNNVDELNFVFNKICSLIKEGVDINKISLFGLGEHDELVFLRLKEHYGLNFNNAYLKTFLDKNYINKFLVDLKSSGLDIALESASLYEEDETYTEFKDIIDRFRLDVDDLKQASIYRGIFKRKFLQNNKYNEAVNVMNHPILINDGYLFIVNFVQGKFPTIAKDDDYLSDKEKSLVGLTTSSDENVANLELFTSYLKQDGHVFVSYSNRNSAEKLSLSPLSQLLKLNKPIHPNSFNLFSQKEASLMYANLKDLRRNYLDNNPLLKSFEKSNLEIPYRTYDYRYKNVIHFLGGEMLKVSYSKIKTYAECKYKFYLDKVLGLDETETTFNMVVGKIAHHIFEHICDNKSFDELYLEAYEEHKDQLDEYDWVYLNRIKEEIRKTYSQIIEFEKQINNPHIYRETKGDSKNYINLSNQILLDGIIDKAITFGNQQDKLVIIDYKSGHEEYSENLVQYGLSMQLPTYALIAREGNRFSNKKLIGLFIQRFINSKAIVSKVDESDESRSLLAGVYLDDVNLIKELDSSLSESPSRYIQSCKLKKDGTISSKRAKNEAYFNELADIAKERIKDSVHSILANDFEINPKIVNGDDKSCKYCPYRDICYRDDKAFKIYSNGTGEENDNE